MELSKKGCKVLFSLFRYLNPIDNVPVAIYKKLFESLVQPILTYNSEKIVKSKQRAEMKSSNFDYITSVDTSPIEKIHLKFCKFALSVGKSSVNIAARAEIGSYPIETYIHCQAVKYLARISKLDNNPLLCDAFSLSKSLHSNGCYSWYSFINNVCLNNGINVNIITIGIPI